MTLLYIRHVRGVATQVHVLATHRGDQACCGPHALGKQAEKMWNIHSLPRDMQENHLQMLGFDICVRLQEGTCENGHGLGISPS